MHRRPYTPRQRRADRRRQLLRDLILGAVVVAIAQVVAPYLPYVQQLQAVPMGTPAPVARGPAGPTLGGTTPVATAQTLPRFATIDSDRGR